MAWDPRAVPEFRPERGPRKESDSPEVLQQVRQTASLRGVLPGIASLPITPSRAHVPKKEACAPATGKTNAYYWTLPANDLRSIEGMGSSAEAPDQIFTSSLLI
jgi:hypothetical protein